MTTTVTAAGVRAAAERIKGAAVVTPLLENEWLNQRTGGRVLMKAETLQHGGSFKFRGAMNRLSKLTPEERARGVLAWSSGNHAQGVARAARLFGARNVIVMPKDAPALKVAQVKAYGGEIVFFDRYSEDREAIARAIADERGATLVPPYDDPAIIAGQGTVGLEIAEQMQARGLSPDVVVAPASGGGLVAGIATAIRSRFPDASIMSAEPEGFDDHARSLRAGRREPHRAEGRTICDALMASIPGELTFAINQRLLAGGVTVSDAEVGQAVGFAFRELKLVVEPGGAVGLAALLAGRFEVRGKTIVIVLSGGNVDADMFARLIA